MTPPPPSRGSVDSSSPPTLVDMGDATLVHYWSERLGASEARIREAMREVGRDSQIVQLYLSRASWPIARHINQ
ncbi:MAG: DUF3606 domain-containing protein [Gammaproteobacteria bacterium]|nr:DUF3606 domain-containing protein [Gammaproteobacteria bacterium]